MIYSMYILFNYGKYFLVGSLLKNKPGKWVISLGGYGQIGEILHGWVLPDLGLYRVKTSIDMI